MKNCMKRVIALLCVLSMVLATGCANTAPEEQEKTDVSAEQTTEKTEESSEAGEKDTLTVLVMDNYVEDDETNYYTQVLEEKAGYCAYPTILSTTSSVWFSSVAQSCPTHVSLIVSLCKFSSVQLLSLVRLFVTP